VVDRLGVDVGCPGVVDGVGVDIGCPGVADGVGVGVGCPDGPVETDVKGSQIVREGVGLAAVPGTAIGSSPPGGLLADAATEGSQSIASEAERQRNRRLVRLGSASRAHSACPAVRRSRSWSDVAGPLSMWHFSCLTTDMGTRRSMVYRGCEWPLLSSPTHTYACAGGSSRKTEKPQRRPPLGRVVDVQADAACRGCLYHIGS
jgi:hypothetical protein